MTSFPDQPFGTARAASFTARRIRPGLTFRVPALALGLLAMLGALGGTAIATAAPETRSKTAPEPTVFAEASERTSRPDVGLTVSLGIRSDLVRSAGLDPFSVSDDLPQSALSIAYGWRSRDRFGLALGLQWDHGESTASARGADATLTIDRLSLGFEGRLSLTNRLLAFARLAPGLLRDHAIMYDASAAPAAYGAQSPSALEQTSWVAAGDVSGGAAFRVATVRGLSGPVFGIWLTAECGYGYAASHALVLAPHVETQPGRVDEPLHLGQLAFSGAFLRARIALSF